MEDRLCCICGGLLEPDSEFRKMWPHGHNAEPVVLGGRCCLKCNWEIVVPARLQNVEEGRPRDWSPRNN